MTIRPKVEEQMTWVISVSGTKEPNLMPKIPIQRLIISSIVYSISMVYVCIYIYNISIQSIH